MKRVTLSSFISSVRISRSSARYSSTISNSSAYTFSPEKFLIISSFRFSRMGFVFGS